MSNSNAMAALRARIVQIRTISAAIPRVATTAVGEVRSIIAANVAAQRGPDGQPWPSSVDGQPVLVGAMKHVDVRAVGSTIVVTVDGTENRHHTGRVRGGKRRDIIPSRAMPETVSEALDKATQTVLTEHLSQ